MKSKILLIGTLLINGIVLSQVGINTPNPEASLDVRAQNHLGSVSSNDGVLVPRVTDLNIDGLTNGQLVYLVGGDEGFYYWKDTQWIKLTSVSTYTGSIIIKQPLTPASASTIINSGKGDFSFRYDRNSSGGWWQIRYNGTGTRKVSVFTTEHWLSSGYSVQAAAQTLNAGVWNAIPGSTYVGGYNELNIFRIYDIEKNSTTRFEGMLINADGVLKESMILEEF